MLTVYFSGTVTPGGSMKRLLVIAAFWVLAAGCYYDARSGEVRFLVHETQEASETDSLEHNMAVQGYMRQHHGKMPPPDYPIYP